MTMLPSAHIYLTMLVLSLMMIGMSNNLWFSWMGIEINSMGFLPMLLDKNKYSIESSVKYFMVQSIGSMILISSQLINFPISMQMLLMSLLLKMGFAPFHQWFASMSENTDWLQIFLLITIQKIPGLMMIYMLKSWNNLYYLMMALTTVSAIIGSISGLFHNSLRKIIVYSSISHMSWIFLSIYMTFSLMLTYLITYMIINWLLIDLFKKNQMYWITQLISMQKNINSLIILLNIMSLASMPPLLGFMPKMLIIKQMMFDENLIILMIMLLSSLISMFFYLRILIMFFMNSTSKKKKKMKKKTLITMNLIITLIPTIIMINSNFKLNKL